MSAPVQQVDVEVRLLERDGHTSDKLAVPGTLSVAQNVEMTREGRYQRRSGSVAHSSIPALSDLESFDGALVGLSEEDLYVYRPDLAGWVSTSNASVPGARQFAARLDPRATLTNQTSHCYVSAGGWDWHFWCDELFGGTRFTAIDPVTGTPVHTIQTCGLGGAQVEVGVAAFVVGASILVIISTAAAAGNASTLLAQRITITTAAKSAVSTVDITTVAATAMRAFDGFVDGSTVVLAYKFDTAGTSRLRVRAWDTATMTSAGVVTSASAYQGNDAIAFMQSNPALDSQYHLALTGGTGLTTVRVQRFSLGLSISGESSIDATFVGKACTGWVDPGTLTEHIWASEYDVALIGRPLRMTYFTRTSGGAVATVLGPIENLTPASRPWTDSLGRPYMLVRYHSNVQPTYFVAVVNNASGFKGPVSRFLSGAGAAYNNPVAGPTVVKDRLERMPIPVVTGDAAVLPAMRLATNSSPAVPVVEAIKVTLSLRDPTVSRIAHVPGALLLPHGPPMRTDKVLVSSWFHLAPEVLAVTAIGGTLAAGQYSYTAVFESVDTNGNKYQSGPATPVTITLAAPGGCAVSYTNLCFHNCNLPPSQTITIAIYRTDVNAGVAAPFKFRARFAMADFGTPAYNDTSISVASGEELYIGDGKILENSPPPPLRLYETWNGRGFYLLEENRRAFGWTKRYQELKGVEFTEIFTGLIDDGYGDLTAMAALGERFLFAKRDAWYWISGDGPDDLGEGSFTEPAIVEGFPGTTNPRSIVTTEMGVFYQAPDMSIWLMGFNLQATRVLAVDDVRMPVVDAMLVSDKRQVHFFVSQAGFGLRLVYDLDHKRWFTWPDANATPMVSACVHGGVGFAATAGGAVRQDSPSAWTDAGVAYLAALELTWVSLGKLAGYCRTWAVQLLGELLGPHTLNITATADFGNAAATRSLASTAIQNAHGYRVEAKVPRQLQQETSLKLLITDNSPATAGFGLEAINLQVGVAPGRRPRLPRGQRMG